MGRNRTGGGRAVGRLRPPLAAPAVADALSAQYFTGAVSTIVSDEAAQLMQDMFGRTLTDSEMAGITGALDGASISVDDYNGDLEFEIFHPLMDNDVSVRKLRRDAFGVFRIENANLFLRDDAPAGLGTRILASQVRAASALGIDSLTTYAAGPPSQGKMNGYYTWGRLGYDSDLSGGLQNQASAAGFSNARTLHDLFKRPGGADWWKANGVGLSMEFDLNAGSTSRKVLDAYTAAKGISLP
jgi:hypothetical protein